MSDDATKQTIHDVVRQAGRKEPARNATQALQAGKRLSKQNSW